MQVKPSTKTLSASKRYPNRSPLRKKPTKRVVKMVLSAHIGAALTGRSLRSQTNRFGTVPAEGG